MYFKDLSHTADTIFFFLKRALICSQKLKSALKTATNHHQPPPKPPPLPPPPVADLTLFPCREHFILHISGNYSVRWLMFPPSPSLPPPSPSLSLGKHMPAKLPLNYSKWPERTVDSELFSPGFIIEAASDDHAQEEEVEEVEEQWCERQLFCVIIL